MKTATYIICVTLFFKVAYSVYRGQHFETKFKHELEDGLRFFPINFLYEISKTQCGMECLLRDECTSFYVDSRACILGVTNTSRFHGNEEMFPDDEQELLTKGKVYSRACAPVKASLY